MEFLWLSLPNRRMLFKFKIILKVFRKAALHWQSVYLVLNVTLWFVFTLIVFDMHKRCRSLREMVTTTGYDPRIVFQLLLNTAQFELNLKEVQYYTITCYKFSLLCCTCTTFVLLQVSAVIGRTATEGLSLPIQPWMRLVKALNNINSSVPCWYSWPNY